MIIVRFLSQNLLCFVFAYLVLARSLQISQLSLVQNSMRVNTSMRLRLSVTIDLNVWRNVNLDFLYAWIKSSNAFIRQNGFTSAKLKKNNRMQSRRKWNKEKKWAKKKKQWAIVIGAALLLLCLNIFAKHVNTRTTQPSTVDRSTNDGRTSTTTAKNTMQSCSECRCTWHDSTAKFWFQKSVFQPLIIFMLLLANVRVLCKSYLWRWMLNGNNTCIVLLTFDTSDDMTQIGMRPTEWRTMASVAWALWS